jgi:hypothetical protein
MTTTLLGSSINTTSGTHTVTATPAVDDMIIIITLQSGSIAQVAPTDNNGGTYTRVGGIVKNSSADGLDVWMRRDVVASGVSTIFTHAPGTTTGGGLIVYKSTGITLNGALAAAKFNYQNNQSSGGTPTPVLNNAAETGHALIGAVFNGTSPATMTPRSSPAYTEDVDTGYSTPTTGIESMHINSGETGTSIAWGNTSASAFGSFILELDDGNFDLRFIEFFDGVSQNLTGKTPDAGNSWSAVWTDTGSDQFITNGSGEGSNTGLAGGGFIYTANINVGGAANSSADTRQQATIKANPDSTHPLYFVTRYQGTGDFYLVGFFGTFIRMYKCVGGTMSQVGSDLTFTTKIEDRIALENYGSVFDVYVNDILKTTFSDSSVSSAGRAGIAAGDVTNRIDNSFFRRCVENRSLLRGICCI